MNNLAKVALDSKAGVKPKISNRNSLHSTAKDMQCHDISASHLIAL